MLNKGLRYCGQVVVKDIGIPEEVYQGLALNCQIIDDSVLAVCREPRSRASHKGTYGHLLAVGGAMGMSGAVTLTAQAALRAGVGLMSCAVPDGVQLHVAVNVPEAMVQPLPGGNQFGEESIGPLKKSSCAIKSGGCRARHERTVDRRHCGGNFAEQPLCHSH